LSRKSSVRPVSKMIRSFEKSKTHCGVCGKTFKTKYELELHKKYSHR
ncbi:MAG: hypothetical protein GQ477_04925, partial [Nanohaloarchaea archaeon]|nr:hypothetical protein [Candidatus Nanohaloarchaea archaeon]